MTEQELKQAHVAKALSQSFTAINAGDFDEAKEFFAEALTVIDHVDYDQRKDVETTVKQVKVLGALHMAMHSIIFQNQADASKYINEAISICDS